jgi:hypothetical protein
MENQTNEIEILKTNFPQIYKVLQENSLDDQSKDEMLKEIEDYKNMFTNTEDFLTLKYILQGEKSENIISRHKLFSTFPNFHSQLIENGIDDYTFYQMIEEFETIKEITNITSKEAEIILKVLNGENIEKFLKKSESEELVEYIKEKKLSVSEVLCDKIIQLNLNYDELKKLKSGEIKKKFVISLKESNDFKKVIDECNFLVYFRYFI